MEMKKLYKTSVISIFTAIVAALTMKTILAANIHVIDAIYGKDNIYCNATNYFQQFCESNSSCDVLVGNEMCGDPIFGIVKEVIVTYQCDNGTEVITQTDENESLTIKCPSVPDLLSTFNVSDGELLIQAGNVDEQVYSVTMQVLPKEEPLRFELTSIQPSSLPLLSDLAILSKDGILHIQAVNVNGQIYAADMQLIPNVDPVQFELLSHQPIFKIDGMYGYSLSGVDGKIYVIGGNEENQILDRVQIFSIADNTITTAQSMLTGRYQHTSTVVDRKIYVIGGLLVPSRSSSCVPKSYHPESDSVEVYDPVLNTWTVASSIPTPRFSHNSTLIDGKIHVRGGYEFYFRGSIISSCTQMDYLSVIPEEIYDPIANIWQLAENDIPSYSDFDVYFNVDYRLRGCAISKGGTQIKMFKKLVCPNKDIQSIFGINVLINLDYLDLRGNKIKDIHPLATLTSLKYLQLRDNDIVDINPLVSLVNLSSLDLDNNPISDISPLLTLVNLRTLRLDVSTISCDDFVTLKNTLEHTTIYAPDACNL